MSTVVAVLPVIFSVAFAPVAVLQPRPVYVTPPTVAFAIAGTFTVPDVSAL